MRIGSEYVESDEVAFANVRAERTHLNLQKESLGEAILRIGSEYVESDGVAFANVRAERFI